MPFNKGWNRWALPQDAPDKDTMKLTMVYNSWSLPMFKDLFLEGNLADMDYNDAMATRNMKHLHETLIDKALLLFILHECAPRLRATKPDLMHVFSDLMLDKNIVALLNACNMTPSQRLADYLTNKIMLLMFCVRQTCRRSRSFRMHELKKQASEGDEIKFTIVKQSSVAFPTHIHHEMTRWDMLDAVFKAISDDPSPAKSGHGASDCGASDTMSVRTMSVADELAMEMVIAEDEHGFPIPPDDHEEATIPPPIWNHEDRMVVDQAISATTGQAVLKSGDQKTIVNLRKMGKDVSDPIKALAEHHAEVKAQRRKMNDMKKLASAKAQGKGPKVKNMKSKQPVKVKNIKVKPVAMKGTHHRKDAWKEVRGGPSDPHKEPCNGKYYFKIGRTHATTPGKERIYFSGKKQGGKYTLILEITKAKCAHYRKDYKDMADYIHCLISSGNVSKKEAKLEYQNALLWHA